MATWPQVGNCPRPHGYVHSVWLKFTASEDKPHAPTVVLSRHSRESRNPLQSLKVPGFPLSRE